MTTREKIVLLMAKRVIKEVDDYNQIFPHKDITIQEVVSMIAKETIKSKRRYKILEQ